MSESASPIKLSLAPMAAEIEVQLYNEYMRPLAGTTIKRIYEYLDTNTGAEDGGRELQGAIPVVGQAVQLYQAGRYAEAVDAGYQAYRYVTVVRSHKSNLPPLELEPSGS